MNTTASYNAHLKTHKDFKCEICHETFNQKIKYMSHMGMHETGKVLECNICGKKFGRSSNFYNHQRIHLGIKKFKCYICGNAFVKAANLDVHLSSHCESNKAGILNEPNKNDSPGNIKINQKSETSHIAEKGKDNALPANTTSYDLKNTQMNNLSGTNSFNTGALFNLEKSTDKDEAQYENEQSAFSQSMYNLL